jgi:hypothetical protein
MYGWAMVVASADTAVPAPEDDVHQLRVEHLAEDLQNLGSWRP